MNVVGRVCCLPGALFEATNWVGARLYLTGLRKKYPHLFILTNGYILFHRLQRSIA